MQRLEISNKGRLQSALKAEIHRKKECRFLHRLHCVLLAGEGCSCYDLARWFGENPRTIERWIHNYDVFGLGGLQDEQRPGRPTKLTDKQMQAVGVAVNNHPRAAGYVKSHWNGHLLASYISTQYGVEFSDRQCQRILRRLQDRLSCSEGLQPDDKN